MMKLRNKCDSSAMYKMQFVHICYILLWSIFYFLQVNCSSEYVVILSHDGPIILGSKITLKADLYKKDGQRPSGEFIYAWKDDAQIPHEYTTKATVNTTTYWDIEYPRDIYSTRTYTVSLNVSRVAKIISFLHTSVATNYTSFNVTSYLNGNITILQSNKTLDNTYVSTASEAKIMINIRKGDYDFISKKATMISAYWFIDCKYYGLTDDFSFIYNFTNANISQDIEVFVMASYNLPTNTTVAPTTSPIPPFNISMPNAVTSNLNITTSMTTVTLPTSIMNLKPTVFPVISTIKSESNTIIADADNISLPYICLNSSSISINPNNTYGYFQSQVNVRAPITNITVEGTNWIQPWDMLSLNVTCKGSGPYYKCLQFHHDEYNITGDEICEYPESLHSCNFSIIHYFLEPTVYTILVILSNDVSKQVYPLTINIYKVTKKPQLSVIIVPVSCSLAAVVLIVFGIAYYIQSRARFTIEVADFDFGQNNPEMEYKTFTERLRDSFNNAVRPGSKRISVRPFYYGSMNY